MIGDPRKLFSMRGIMLSGGGFFGRFPWGRRLNRSGGSRRTSASAGGSGSGGKPSSYWSRVRGFQGPLKAALTSGSLSATGDLLAQALQAKDARSRGAEPAPYDPSRTLRMFGFGLCFYGPYQYYWYNLLDHLMPIKTTATFLAKVASNQLLLAPVTLTAVFSWNLALTQQADGIAAKIQTDLLPTMVNGWKFWVPAASVNFYAVPLQYQVLYMSACGVLWTAYLSYASTVRIAAPAAAAAPSTAMGGGSGTKASSAALRK